MYWKDTFSFDDSNEIEIKFAGRYGAKGEKRAPKIKASPEQIAAQNQRNRAKNMRRVIKANFKVNDHWCTLKYPAGTRKSIEDVKKDLRLFLQRLRRAYAKKGEEVKFIYRIEIGARGGIHIHIIINRSRGEPASDIIIKNAWKVGAVNFENLYAEGGWEKLADYITKPPNEEQSEQLSLFPVEEQEDLVKYSSSRNLIRPKPERKYYTRRTVKKLLEEGPQPSKGYIIDKESIRQGVNPYTGRSYLYYTEIKIKSEPPDRGEKRRKNYV